MSPSQRRALGSRLSACLVVGLVFASTLACYQRAGIRPVTPPDDVVGDGYVERTRDEAGGGVHSVSFDAEPSKNATRVEEMLIGRFPGVEVMRTGNGGYSVTIRGTGSFLSSEQPLWVVDGTPVEVSGGRGLSWLTPADVVRINVLKNPSETSIYGVRGANGVIVISTRRNR